MGAGGRGRDEDDGKEGQAAGAGLKGMWKEGRGCSHQQNPKKT
jgi:hypothetical protein